MADGFRYRSGFLYWPGSNLVAVGIPQKPFSLGLRFIPFRFRIRSHSSMAGKGLICA